MPNTDLKTIYLVEDDPDIQVIAEMCLTELGDFEVSVFGSGTDFFEGLETEKPQLVLLDVMLPEMDGPAILSRMRENPDSAGIPVIFMTAKVRPMDQAEYQALGVLGVIGKPFEPTALVAKIEELWQVREER